MYDFAEVVLPVYPAAEGGKAGLGGRWRQWWAFLRGDAYVNPFRGWRGRTLGPGIGVTTGPYRLRTTGRRLRVNDTGITVREADGNEAHFPYSRVGLLRLSTIILVRGSGADGTHQKTLDELAFEVGAHRHTLCFRAERAEATALMTSLATWGDFHFVHQPNLEGKTQRSVSDGQNEYYAKLVYQKVSRSAVRFDAPARPIVPPVLPDLSLPSRPSAPPAAAPAPTSPPPYVGTAASTPGGSDTTTCAIGPDGMTIGKGWRATNVSYGALASLQLAWYVVRRWSTDDNLLTEQHTYHELTYRTTGGKGRTYFLPTEVKHLSSLRYHLQTWTGSTFHRRAALDTDTEHSSKSARERHVRTVFVMDLARLQDGT